MKLFNASWDTQDPFHMFEAVISVSSPDHLQKGGALLLHGGEDISPSIYNHKNSKYCHAKKEPSVRDQLELDLIKRAVSLEMPIIGICRGAQLLCAFDGGHLVQHIVGHATEGHNVVSEQYGNLGVSNSAHHQMMQPRKSRDNNIIGYVEETLYGYEEKDILREYQNCPEIIHFNKIKGFGIQGHPEWMKRDDLYLNNCIKIMKDVLL